MPANEAAPALNTELIKANFALVERRADHLSNFFYKHLFHHNPGVRHLFPDRMEEQQDRLFAALTMIAMSVDDLDTLVPYLQSLGFDHRKFDALAEHYAAVGASLIATLKHFSKQSWSAEIEAQWAAAYGVATTVMTQAASDVPEETPRRWDAQIIAHTRRTDDVAVLTLRPNNPFPFEAGQHTALTIPQVPQVWRPFSIANAPRRDGTVDFHVRRIPGGQLSTALVERVSVGGMVRLGPPVGTMTLPKELEGNALCVAGGTGWSAIKSLVEAVPTRPQSQPMTVLIGVRNADDVYDLDELDRLNRSFGWLDLTVALPSSHHPRAGSDRQLLQLVAAYAQDHRDVRQVYVSGPPGMVQAVEERLHECGISPDVIHRDGYNPRPGLKRPSSPAQRLIDPPGTPWIHPR